MLSFRTSRRGDEHDGNALKSWMVAHQLRKLETIAARHVYIRDDERDVRLDENSQRVVYRSRGQQILAELSQSSLIGDELCRCVVDQQNVDRRSRLRPIITFAHAGTTFPASPPARYSSSI